MPIICIRSSPSLLDEPLVQADAAFLASVERHLDTIMTVDEISILDAEHILLLKIVKSLFNDSKTDVRPYFKKVLRALSLFHPYILGLRSDMPIHILHASEATHFRLMLQHTL